MTSQGFPGSSVGKESAFNVGDPGLIPGSERSSGEGIGHPLQYTWSSLVAQLVQVSFISFYAWPAAGSRSPEDLLRTE